MSETIAICLGWDVGGWHGQKDGLAAVVLRRNGSVDRVGRTVRMGLSQDLWKSEFTIERLLEITGVIDPSPKRVLLAIDAPFGLPQAFVANVCNDLATSDLTDLPNTGMIENRFAYRYTDRFVWKTTKKRPISPSFDKLTNNAVKARLALAQLRRNSSCRVVPFDVEDGMFTAIEVYPALCGQMTEGFATLLADMTSTDERDACLSALVAAAYEAKRIGLMTDLPDVALPPEDPPDIKTEGWIVFPLTVDNRRSDPGAELGRLQE